MTILIPLIVALAFSRGIQSVEYRIEVKTARGSSTESPVFMTIKGNTGSIDEFQLVNPLGKSNNFFTSDSTNTYARDMADVGSVCSVKLRLAGQDSWLVSTVKVWKKDKNEFRVVEFQFHSEIDNEVPVKRTERVDGGWGAWSEWPMCITECDEESTVNRNRRCNNPTPGCGGQPCEGVESENRTCVGPVCLAGPTVDENSNTTLRNTTNPKGKPRNLGEDKNMIIIIVAAFLGLSFVINLVLAAVLCCRRGNSGKKGQTGADNKSYQSIND